MASKPQIKGLGDRIRDTRKLLGLSQTKLGGAAGVSKGAVSQWENGSSANLRLEHLFAVADALNCSARWLALGDVPQAKPARLDTDERQVLDLYRMMRSETREGWISIGNTLLAATTATPNKNMPYPHAAKAKR